MSDPAILKETYLPKYLAGGEQRFYRLLLTYALNKLIIMREEKFNSITPDIELLECANNFLFLYRREGDEVFFKMSKVFRKAAHKIYRVMLKKNITNKNIKFLNLV